MKKHFWNTKTMQEVTRLVGEGMSLAEIGKIIGKSMTAIQSKNSDLRRKGLPVMYEHEDLKKRIVKRENLALNEKKKKNPDEVLALLRPNYEN